VTTEVITGFLYHCGRKSLRELSICGPFVREQASPALCYIICEKLDVQLEAYFYSFIKMKKRMVRYKQDLNFIGYVLNVGNTEMRAAKDTLKHQFCIIEWSEFCM
jgi:hypothetical protein